MMDVRAARQLLGTLSPTVRPPARPSVSQAARDKCLQLGAVTFVASEADCGNYTLASTRTDTNVNRRQQLCVHVLW